MTEFTTLFLAMQGAFAEHQAMFQKLSPKKSVTVILVRTPEELARCDALVIPGGGKPTFVHVPVIRCITYHNISQNQPQ